MKGRKFLKVTGILMIIGAVFSLLAGVIFGGLGAVVAGLGGMEALTFSYWIALLLTLAGGICELIAGIKGVKHSKSGEKAKDLIKWGVVAAVFSVLGIVMNLVNGEELSILNVVTTVIIPILYIYGAVLNSKASDTQPAE